MTTDYKPEDYTISSEKSKIDVNVVYNFLKTSYWAENIPYDIVRKCVANSHCYGVYCKENMVGFARIVSDFTTFAYLADVFILEEHRGRGLSKKLMKEIMADPKLQNLRTWMLATLDAHGLYKQFGFEPLKDPNLIMSISSLNFYNDMLEKMK